MAAPAQYLKFCRCGPNRFSSCAQQHSFLLLLQAARHASQPSPLMFENQSGNKRLEHVGASKRSSCSRFVHRGCAPAATGAASASFLARTLHLRRALVGSISRLHHRLKSMVRESTTAGSWWIRTTHDRFRKPLLPTKYPQSSPLTELKQTGLLLQKTTS